MVLDANEQGREMAHNLKLTSILQGSVTRSGWPSYTTAPACSNSLEEAMVYGANLLQAPIQNVVVVVVVVLHMIQSFSKAWQGWGGRPHLTQPTVAAVGSVPFVEYRRGGCLRISSSNSLMAEIGRAHV